MRFKILFLVLALSASMDTFAQDDLKTDVQLSDSELLKNYEDTLAVLAYAVLNDSLAEHRFAACHKLIPTLVKALKIKNSFDHPFDRLKSISIQYPADSTFRIFTWQLFVDDEEYRYYGAIQKNSEDLELYPLVDRSHEIDIRNSFELTPNRWYGALYYNLREFDSPEGKKYLLFGFDGFSFFNKRKLIEVLQFRDGKPVFGAPSLMTFNPKTERLSPKYRLILEYSSEAAIRLNYDSALGHIIHDHLILVGGMHGQGPTYVPDGSYEGYELQQGQWVHIPKVFHQTQDTPPINFPVLGKEEDKGKNIFGKKGGK